MYFRTSSLFETFVTYKLLINNGHCDIQLRLVRNLGTFARVDKFQSKTLHTQEITDMHNM